MNANVTAATVDPSPSLGGRGRCVKGFLGRKYADVNVADIDLKFLNSVLMHFDPQYFAAYFAEQAKTEKEKQRGEERAAFGESGDVRSTTVTPQLTEQQEHMADML